MLTRTSTTAQIEITTEELGKILAAHFANEIKMTPTEYEFVFSNNAGAIRQYVKTITFIAHNIVDHTGN